MQIILHMGTVKSKRANNKGADQAAHVTVKSKIANNKDANQTAHVTG